MPVYVVTNTKGGVGKTVTAAEMTLALARGGRRVLAVDLDPQGHLSTRLGLPPEEATATAAAMVEHDAHGVIMRRSRATEAAIAAPQIPGAEVLVGTRVLSDINWNPRITLNIQAEIPKLLQDWDDVVVDTPGNFGVISMGALAAADVIVACTVPAGESYDELAGLFSIVRTEIAGGVRPGQDVHWIVPCMVNPQVRSHQEILDSLRRQFPGKVTPPVRRGDAPVMDSYYAHQPVGLAARRSKPAQDYVAALTPVLAGSIRRKATTSDTKAATS